MVFKKKLPLAVVISMSTMLMMHVFMPINLHGAGSGSPAEEEEDSATNQKKRTLNLHPLEDCPEDGDLLSEDEPYWSDRLEAYRKPKYQMKVVDAKPLSDICCTPNNYTKKSFGYMDPPAFNDKSLNPCWYEDKKLKCMPYFYIIGATKSATTDLFKRILTHPDVRSTRKEIHWFSRLRTLGAGLDWYSHLFDTVAKEIHSEIKGGAKSHIVIGEGSLDYLSDVHVWEHFTGNQGCYEPRITIANHIRNINPNAKIIINLRDPIQRVYATYLYTAAARERLKDPSTQKLHEQVSRAVPVYKECLKRLPVRACVYNRTLTKLHPIDIISGAYAPFVEDWVRTFTRKQVYAVKFEDYANDMAATTKEIIEFLGLPPFKDSDFNQMKSMGKLAQNVYYRVGPIQNRTAKLLRDFYTPFNTRLSKILEDDRFLWKK